MLQPQRRARSASAETRASLARNVIEESWIFCTTVIPTLCIAVLPRQYDGGQGSQARMEPFLRPLRRFARRASISRLNCWHFRCSVAAGPWLRGQHMKYSYAAAVSIGLGLMVSGCATKQYGRMQPLSSAEMTNYNCREIVLEQSKVDAFDEQIRDQAGFNGASALGVLGDFGIGNAMAKGGAEKSSIERRRQLQVLSSQRGCDSTPLRTAPRPVAPAEQQPAVTQEAPAPRSGIGGRVRCITCRD